MNRLRRYMKVYCENGALTTNLVQLQKAGIISLINFPNDPNSWSRKISPTAKPSALHYQDIVLPTKVPFHCTYDELGVGSEKYPRILAIVGTSNRRDALHVDSAYRSGCHVFVTKDKDILDHRNDLESLLSITILHADVAHITIKQIMLEKLADDTSEFESTYSN